MIGWKLMRRRDPGGTWSGSRAGTQLSTAHLDHPTGWRAALSPGCCRGKWAAMASSSPEPLDTGLSSVQPSPSLSSASTGLGPGGECAGARMEPKNSERNWKGNRGSRVSSGGSLRASQPPLHLQPLPSWVGESQALYWARHHCPQSRGQGYRGAGGRGKGEWRVLPGSPHCPQSFPWRSCRSRCRHWQSHPGGACCWQGEGVSEPHRRGCRGRTPLQRTERAAEAS